MCALKYTSSAARSLSKPRRCVPIVTACAACITGCRELRVPLCLSYTRSQACRPTPRAVCLESYWTRPGRLPSKLLRCPGDVHRTQRALPSRWRVHALLKSWPIDMNTTMYNSRFLKSYKGDSLEVFSGILIESMSFLFWLQTSLR